MKSEETVEITYLEGKKQQTNYGLTSSEVLKYEKTFYSWFEGQRKAFLVIINKQKRCDLCT